MTRKSDPVTALIAKPAMAHGISALTSRIGRPRKQPISRRSSTPAPPISMHRPTKCSDPHAGQSHVRSNKAFEMRVVSSQAANSCIFYLK